MLHYGKGPEWGGCVRHALLVQGGWEGHQPLAVAELLASLLREEGVATHISDTLDSFCDESLMAKVDLIVPVWTMGTITSEQLQPLLAAVHRGVGLAGCHGGLGDAFRGEPEFQYMVGGQWVAHPGNDGVTYDVDIVNPAHPLTDGMEGFSVCSEQYYMHVDPDIEVLATTTFFNRVRMPVAWTKTYGSGRVFYCSLGHQAHIVAMPPVSLMMRRGMVWATK